MRKKDIKQIIRLAATIESIRQDISDLEDEQITKSEYMNWLIALKDELINKNFNNHNSHCIVTIANKTYQIGPNKSVKMLNL